MDTIAEFNDNHGFNVKLTKEKIFIDAAGSSETIALRGLNGVGLYDDLEKYNQELKLYKSDQKVFKGLKWFFIIIGVLITYLSFPDVVYFGVFFLLLGFFLEKIVNFFSKDKTEPVLDSYFRLMLSGGDRKFKFNKSDSTSVQIADFINKVEDTLTAYK
ncbi:MAG: hypothetical protein CMD14_00580 [Flavobacteriales bacterium]|nr:hypothetical protein [Flavobacteriales bacterium]|tara:strand:+ start:966 stop:1442 length:477 start_codon:yes stop_codon:yes gene_type:complete